MATLADFLERVGRRDRGDGADTRARPRDHRVDRPAAHERPGRIVDENDGRVVGQRIESGAHRIDTLGPTRHEPQPRLPITMDCRATCLLCRFEGFQTFNITQAI